MRLRVFSSAENWAGTNGVVVLVKFDPADIVSVPTDCQYSKMRVSKYTVVSVAREQLEEEVYTEEDEYEEDYFESGTDF